MKHLKRLASGLITLIIGLVGLVAITFILLECFRHPWVFLPILTLSICYGIGCDIERQEEVEEKEKQEKLKILDEEKL